MRTAERRVLRGAAAGLVFGLCMVGSLLAAFHRPVPHALPVAVVAPAGVTATIVSTLEARRPGAFRVDRYPTGSAARAAVTDGSHHGAFVVGPHGTELMVAGAGGSAPVNLLTRTFTPVSAAERLPLRVIDVVPPADGDRQGLSAFFVALGLVFSSVVFGGVGVLVGRGARVRVQALTLVGFALVIGAGAAFLADGVLGALTGHYPLLAGLLALFSLAILAPTAALTRISAPAFALAALTFVALEVPATGGPAGLAPFLPSFFRSLAPILPMSEVISGITGAHYYGGAGVSRAVLVLAAWSVTGLAVLLVAGSVRDRRAAEGTPEPVPATAEV